MKNYLLIITAIILITISCTKEETIICYDFSIEESHYFVYQDEIIHIDTICPYEEQHCMFPSELDNFYSMISHIYPDTLDSYNGTVIIGCTRYDGKDIIPIVNKTYTLIL